MINENVCKQEYSTDGGHGGLCLNESESRENLKVKVSDIDNSIDLILKFRFCIIIDAIAYKEI